MDVTHRKITEKIRDQPLTRPLSFRSFFPSLKELLPITPFVNRDGALLDPANLAEHNDFLQNLEDTSSRLPARGIKVTTIAGDELTTLATIPVGDSRTAEDITLERWRDGHAAPDPPQADSTAGDQTVLIDSVQSVGTAHIVRGNVSHEELPSLAQNEIADLLVDVPVGDFVPLQLASAAVGIDVLSPVLPVITGPNGEILSADQNTFPNADFDWDPAEPEGIKVLTITDPPPGEFAINLAGLNTGDYTVIITYADGDETFTSEQTNSTTPGEQGQLNFTIGEQAGASITIEIVDIRDLLQQVIDLAKEAHKNKLITGHQRAVLTRPAMHALKNLNKYEGNLNRGRDHAAAGRLEDYYEELDKLAKASDQLAHRPGLASLAAEFNALLARIRANSPA